MNTIPVRIHITLLLALMLISVSASADGIVELPVRDSLGNIKAAALVRPDPDGALAAGDLLTSDDGFVAFDPDFDRNSPPVWLKLYLSPVRHWRRD